MFALIRRGAVLLTSGLVAGCGGEAEMPMEPPLVTTPPPAVLSGRVIAAGSFEVPATATNFRVDQYSGGAPLPADIGPTTGQLLVLSVKDVSRPDIACTGGIGGSNCAIIVALPTRSEGFVSVQSESARTNYYIHSTFRLEIDPDPA